MGRKTKLTPALQTRIVELLRAGNYAVTVCNAVGITEQTFLNWMHRGERNKRGDKVYFEFFESVKKAEADAESSALVHIRLAGQTEWQANAWYLERRHPDRWGRREMKVQHQGEVQITVKYENKRGDGLSTRSSSETD